MPEKENELNIAVIKNDINHIKAEIGNIKENHLPHIYKRLISVERKIAYWSGGIALLIIVMGILTSLF